MQMKRFLGVLIVLMGAWLVWTTNLAAQNDDEGPVNVGLLYFTAAVQSNGVRLDWGTATELNTAGFIVQRSTGSSFVTLDNIGFIASEGGVATGATYSALDTTAVTGQTYTYKLIEIETDSSQHDLDTVTVTFDPQPTATAIVIGSNNPTPRPSNTPVPTSTAVPSATNTAVPTLSRSTATPRPTTNAQPTATPESSNILTTPQPTSVPQTSPTAAVIVDQAFDNSPGASGANSNDSNDGVVFAQEEPTPAAYPGPDTTTSDTPTNATSYPAGQEPALETAPENPTPYPASTLSEAVPTLAIIGSDNPYPPETNTTAPQSSSEAVRGRILLWAGFLLALFIFLSGVVGAIVLYRRRPA